MTAKVGEEVVEVVCLQDDGGDVRRWWRRCEWVGTYRMMGVMVRNLREAVNCRP